MDPVELPRRRDWGVAMWWLRGQSVLGRRRKRAWPRTGFRNAKRHTLQACVAWGARRGVCCTALGGWRKQHTCGDCICPETKNLRAASPLLRCPLKWSRLPAGSAKHEIFDKPGAVTAGFVNEQKCDRIVCEVLEPSSICWFVLQVHDLCAAFSFEHL